MMKVPVILLNYNSSADCCKCVAALKRQDIHSLVVVPLYIDGKIIGFYGVDNPPGRYLDYAQNMLQIMGHFITGSLKRRNLVKQLQDLSYHDQLTRLGNRHALDEYISGICREESIGVASAPSRASSASRPIWAAQLITSSTAASIFGWW